MYKRIFNLSGLFGSLLFIATTIIGGFLNPGYNHVTQFISELYAVNAPHADALRYWGYVPSGVFISLFSFTVLKASHQTQRSRLAFMGLGIFYGAFTIMVSIFNCDEGCNKSLVDPTVSQIIHNTAGLLTYLIVPVCLIMLGLEARNWGSRSYLSKPGIIAGIISGTMVLVLFLNPSSPMAGLIQRIIELNFLGWIMLCSLSFSRKEQ